MPKRILSIIVGSLGKTVPETTSTAQVPQVPSPRQFINLLLSLCGETIPDFNRAVRKIAPRCAVIVHPLIETEHSSGSL